MNERDTPDIPELKPCRYCGGRAEIVKKRFTYFVICSLYERQ